MLHINGLTYRIGGRLLLEEATVAVPEGHKVGIVGRNGAGKTTLLQILCGITTQTRGSFEVEGRIAPILALGSSFDFLLTGRANARIAAAILGLTNKEVEARIEDIKEYAAIGEAFEHPVRTYSMGMIARLAFAVCVHADADVLIVDEALSVGDQIFQEKCEAFIDHFASHGTTLIVSHDLHFLEERCDSVLWLEKGVVREYGDPYVVINAYRDAMHAEQGPLHAWALRYISRNG